MTHPLFGFLFLFLLLLFDAEEIAEAVEVFLHDEAETLRVQTVARKIAVVGLIVHAYGEVAAREDEVAEVKIADETLRGIRIVAIAKLTIEQQAIVALGATDTVPQHLLWRRLRPGTGFLAPLPHRPHLRRALSLPPLGWQQRRSPQRGAGECQQPI